MMRTGATRGHYQKPPLSNWYLIVGLAPVERGAHSTQLYGGGWGCTGRPYNGIQPQLGHPLCVTRGKVVYSSIDLRWLPLAGAGDPARGTRVLPAPPGRTLPMCGVVRGRSGRVSPVGTATRGETAALAAHAGFTFGLAAGLLAGRDPARCTRAQPTPPGPTLPSHGDVRGCSGVILRQGLPLVRGETAVREESVKASVRLPEAAWQPETPKEELSGAPSICTGAGLPHLHLRLQPSSSLAPALPVLAPGSSPGLGPGLGPAPLAARHPSQHGIGRWLP